MKHLYTLLAICVAYAISLPARAQDPALPSANFGFNNMNAGVSRKPGVYYAGYLQAYSSSSVRNADGEVIANAPDRGSITSLQQVTWVSSIKVFDAHLCATILIPIVKNSNTANTGQSTNPNSFGDLLIGPFIEGKKDISKGTELHYRFGVNFFFPTGAYSSAYTFNPSAHRYRIFPHLECSFIPSKRFAVSVKNNLYFYTRELGSPQRSGTAYNLNYAFQYTLGNKVTLLAAGYYLKQLGQDSYNGDTNYYQRNYGIKDTRERVFAAGTGLGYKTNSAVTIELKAMWEMAAVNRPQGFRSNLLVALPL